MGEQLRQLLLFLSSVAKEVAFNWNPVYPLEVTFEHQHSYVIGSECRSATYRPNRGRLRKRKIKHVKTALALKAKFAGVMCLTLTRKRPVNF